MKHGLCPEGWSIPNKSQFTQLINFLGDDVDDKLKIADNDLWPNRKEIEESVDMPNTLDEIKIVSFNNPKSIKDIKENHNGYI